MIKVNQLFCKYPIHSIHIGCNCEADSLGYQATYESINTLRKNKGILVTFNTDKAGNIINIKAEATEVET